jgi:hypothetical protein
VEAIADALLATLPPRFWLAGFSFVSFREPILSRAVEAETLASLQSTEATEATARAMIRSIDSAAWRR